MPRPAIRPAIRPAPRRRSSAWGTILGCLGVILLLLLIAGGIWLQLAGPCWIYKYERVAHIPARCLSHFEQP